MSAGGTETSALEAGLIDWGDSHRHVRFNHAPVRRMPSHLVDLEKWPPLVRTDGANPLQQLEVGKLLDGLLSQRLRGDEHEDGFRRAGKKEWSCEGNACLACPCREGDQRRLRRIECPVSKKRSESSQLGKAPIGAGEPEVLLGGRDERHQSHGKERSSEPLNTALRSIRCRIQVPCSQCM